MKKVVVGFAVALLSIFFFSSTFAENTLKIGVVNFQKVVQGSSEIGKERDKLKDKFAPEQKKLVDKQKALEEMMAKYKKDSAVMKDSEKKSMEESIGKSRGEFIAMTQKYQEQMVQAQQDVMKSILDKITKAVKDIAKKDNLNVVLSQETILYADDSFDITSKVIDSLK